MSKKYTTNFLEDTNGSTGSANQVLISTPSGIDWVDGSGSGIIGGPYLPLSAGSSYPLTDTLHIDSSSSGSYHAITFERSGQETYNITHGTSGLFFTQPNTTALLLGLTQDGDITVYNSSSSEYVRFDQSSQSVGIGTTSPNHKLDIYSNENVPLRIHRPSNANLDSSGAWGIGFSTRNDANNSTTDTRAGIFSYYNGNLFLAANNTSIVSDPDAYARLTVLSTGNVGIGTTSPAQNFVVADTTNGNGVELVPGATATIQTYNRGTSTYTNLNIDTLETRVRSIGATVFNNGSGFSEAMRIDSSGNVGIGTTSPGSRRLNVVTSSSGTDVGIESKILRTSGTNYSFLGFASGSGAAQNIGGFFSATGATTNTALWAYNGEVLLATQSTTDYVGIGTTSPDRKLTVNGSANVFDSLLVNSNTPTTDTTTDAELVIQAKGNQAGTIRSSQWYFQTIPDSIYGNSAFRIAKNYDGGATSEFMRINSSGNVGIGTTSPSNKLHVNSGTTNEVAKFESTDGTAYLSIMDSNTTNSLQGIGSAGDKLTFYSNGAERMRINSSGNVGIGTTSPNNFGFLEKVLNISAGSSSSTTLQQAGIVISGSSDGDDANDFGYLSFTNYQSAITNDRVAEIRALKNGTNVDTGEFAFYTSSGSGPAERMRITSTGNVGIGTVSPLYALDVDGDVQINETLFAKASADLILQARASQVVGINSGGSRAMTLDDSQNVGIGTTSPNYKLEVDGTLGVSRTDGIIFAGSSGLGTGSKIVSNTSNDLIFNTALASLPYTTTERVRVLNNGNVGIGTTSPDDKLHVNQGSDAFRGITIEGTTPALYLKDTQATNAHHIGSNGNYLYFLEDSNQSGGYNNIMAFWDPSNNFIFSLGNVGIGTTNPSEKLEVAGNARITGDVTLSNGNALRWTSDDVRIEGTTAGDNIKFYVANTEILQLAQSGTLATVTGNLKVTGGDIEVQDSSNGLILRSPNGTRYRITVDNSGNLTTTAI